MIHILEFIKYFQQQSKPRGVVYYTCENPRCRSMALSGSRSCRIVFNWAGSPGAAVRMAVSGSRPVTLSVSPWARACLSRPLPSMVLHLQLEAELFPRKRLSAAGHAALDRGCPWLGIPELAQQLLGWASHRNGVCDSFSAAHQ